MTDPCLAINCLNSKLNKLNSKLNKLNKLNKKVNQLSTGGGGEFIKTIHPYTGDAQGQKINGEIISYTNNIVCYLHLKMEPTADVFPDTVLVSGLPVPKE